MCIWGGQTVNSCSKLTIGRQRMHIIHMNSMCTRSLMLGKVTRIIDFSLLYDFEKFHTENDAARVVYFWRWKVDIKSLHLPHWTHCRVVAFQRPNVKFECRSSSFVCCRHLPMRLVLTWALVWPIQRHKCMSSRLLLDMCGKLAHRSPVRQILEWKRRLEFPLVSSINYYQTIDMVRLVNCVDKVWPVLLQKFPNENERNFKIDRSG